LPYIKKPFYAHEPTAAYALLMRQMKLSLKEAQRYVDRGRVFYEGFPVAEKNAILDGPYDVVVYEPVSQGLMPFYENDDFALFDKPSGVLVHPTSRKTPYSLLDEILFFLGKEAKIVHRLDRETSGLILVAKHKKSEVFLKQCFEKRQIEKSYLALVRGKITAPFEVDAPLLNNQDYRDIKLRMVVNQEGKPCLTRFVPLTYHADIDATLIEAFPVTGRQHQIRAHLFHVKHPILGDPLYGVPTHISEAYLDELLSDKERMHWMGAPRLLLHAHALSFAYEDQAYTFTSPQATGEVFYRLAKEKHAICSVK
jgi:23S rRNA pseudouridine1911/1915/1917 synthase